MRDEHHAELFEKVLFQPIGLGMLAFVVAIKGTMKVAASVSLIWIAAGVAILGVDRAIQSCNPLLRDMLVVWTVLSFVVFSTCTIAWIRERNAERP